MSDNRRKGETVEQYACRLVSDYADGDADAFEREFACVYCSGPSSMGLCRAIRQVSEQAKTQVSEPLPQWRPPPH
jgi:hypothetical protein